MIAAINLAALWAEYEALCAGCDEPPQGEAADRLRAEIAKLEKDNA